MTSERKSSEKDLPPAYVSTQQVSSKPADGTGTAGSSKRTGHDTLVEGLVTPNSLPDRFLYASPPAVVDVPYERAYPKCVIRNGNIFSPENDPSFVLYHMAEATYPVKYESLSSTTNLTKAGGAIHGNQYAYTVVHQEAKSKRYTDMMILLSISTSKGGYWSLYPGAGMNRDVGIQLAVTSKPKAHPSIKLILTKRSFDLSYRGSPVNILRKRLEDGASKEEPSTRQQPYTWIDQETGAVLATEASQAWLNSDKDRPIEDALTFSDSPPVNPQLRDILTAVWAISLWIDAWAEKTRQREAARRAIEGDPEESSFLGRLFGGLFGNPAKPPSTFTSSAPVVARNPLREELGLAAPDPNFREHKFWYE